MPAVDERDLGDPDGVPGQLRAALDADGAGALQQARVSRLVYGAPDQKVGAAGTVVNPLQNPRLLHRVEVQGGVLAGDALTLLRRFFDDRR